MHVELTHTFQVPVKKVWDYTDDFKTWPAWYSGLTGIIEPETGAWTKPGDQVRYSYKLLGRHVEGVATLEEKEEPELTKLRTEIPGLPAFHFEYRLAEAGAEASVLKVVMDTEEPTSFFGKSIDRMLLPQVGERDVKRSLENLDDIFAAGVLE